MTRITVLMPRGLIIKLLAASLTWVDFRQQTCTSRHEFVKHNGIALTMGFLDLPNELISRIVKSLTDGENLDYRSLKHLRLCSSRLDAITQPVLYSCFKETKPNSLFKLLTGISQNQKSTLYIQNFRGGNLLWWRPPEPPGSHLYTTRLMEILSSPLGEDIRKLFENDAFESKTRAELVEALEAGGRNAIATVAVLSLPALHHIALGMLGLRYEELELLQNNPTRTYDWRDFSWMNWAFRRAGQLQLNSSDVSPAPGDLSRLRSVELSVLEEGKVCFSHILPYLSLQSVRRFSGRRISIHWDIQTKISLSNIRYLRMEELHLPDDSLARFMALFTSLIDLELETGLFIKLATHIKHLKSSLKRLSLRNTYGSQAYVQMPSHRSSYAGFDNLDYLRLEAPHVNGWVSDLIVNPDLINSHESELIPLEEVIPRNVQDLVFSSCGQRFLEKMGNLMASDWLKKSKLRRLRLNCHWKYKTWIEGVKDDWEADCKLAGVHLIISFRYH